MISHLSASNIIIQLQNVTSWTYYYWDCGGPVAGKCLETSTDSLCDCDSASTQIWGSVNLRKKYKQDACSVVIKISALVWAGTEATTAPPFQIGDSVDFRKIYKLIAPTWTTTAIMTAPPRQIRGPPITGLQKNRHNMHAESFSKWLLLHEWPLRLWLRSYWRVSGLQ